MQRSSNTDIQLVSFHLCPYVQRVAIVLAEKRVPYDIEYIDLSDKPSWFLEISPFGKVPVLRIGQTVLFESAIICEYLDESHGVAMQSSDPLQKAFDRAWVEVASNLNGIIHKLMIATTKDQGEEAASQVRAQFAKLEKQLEAPPFFHGNNFGLVDAATAPALQRARWCERLQSSLSLFDEVPKISAWTDALLTRPSIQSSTVSDIYERFLEYLRGNRGINKSHETPSFLVS